MAVPRYAPSPVQRFKMRVGFGRSKHRRQLSHRRSTPPRTPTPAEPVQPDKPAPSAPPAPTDVRAEGPPTLQTSSPADGTLANHQPSSPKPSPPHSASSDATPQPSLSRGRPEPDTNPSVQTPAPPKTLTTKKSQGLLGTLSRKLRARSPGPEVSRVPQPPSSPISRARPSGEPAGVTRKASRSRGPPLPNDFTSKNRREDALRARGLIPKTLSDIEAEEDRRLDAQRQSGSEDGPSRAKEIVEQWRSKHSGEEARSLAESGAPSEPPAAATSDEAIPKDRDATEGELLVSLMSSADLFLYHPSSEDQLPPSSGNEEGSADLSSFAPDPNRGHIVLSSRPSSEAHTPLILGGVDKVSQWLRQTPPSTPGRDASPASRLSEPTQDSESVATPSPSSSPIRRSVSSRQSTPRAHPPPSLQLASSPRSQSPRPAPTSPLPPLPPSPLSATSSQQHLRLMPSLMSPSTSSSSQSPLLTVPASPTLPSLMASSASQISQSTLASSAHEHDAPSRKGRMPPTPIIVETVEEAVMRHESMIIEAEPALASPLEVKVVDEFGVTEASSSPVRPRPPKAAASPTHRKSLGFFSKKKRSSTLPPPLELATSSSMGNLRRAATGRVPPPPMPQAPLRSPVSPTMYSRGSILMSMNAIDDEESRRLSEMAFLD